MPREGLVRRVVLALCVALLAPAVQAATPDRCPVDTRPDLRRIIGGPAHLRPLSGVTQSTPRIGLFRPDTSCGFPPVRRISRPRTG
ncbi:hypothetical protein SKB0092_27940 [Roseomonas mucosa]